MEKYNFFPVALYDEDKHNFFAWNLGYGISLRGPYILILDPVNQIFLCLFFCTYYRFQMKELFSLNYEY